jgi:methylenetetrahydrofolate dehydrogenase (NADP+)/methenyltetrahydrofolate cyclohydrolase
MIELQSSQLVDELRFATASRAAKLIDTDIQPHVAVVLVGEDESSLRYISIKEKQGKHSGVLVSVYHIESPATYEEVEATLTFLATDPDVHGVILQLPLPVTFTAAQREALIALIPAEKDVDGLTGAWESEILPIVSMQSLGTSPTFIPPMVCSVVSLLEHYQISLTGKSVVVVGKGRLVGQPLDVFFKNHGVSSMTVDEETDNIIARAKQADIIIAGTGTKDLITYQWVKEGGVVLDAAEDVHRQSVDQIASAVSPARGGLGPLTVSWLLANTVTAAERTTTHANHS